MARIRTIKPEFFRHASLYRAEIDTGLPLRVAFAGIWTTADREGRFKWRPEELKLDALPFDIVDFSRVLDALCTGGFIVRYTVGDKQYGFIPSWHAHQSINARETASTLPDPNGKTSIIVHQTDAPTTDGEPVAHASPTRHDPARGEGKGKEGKGKEGNLFRAAASPQHQREFASFKAAYPKRDGSQGWKVAEAKFEAAVRSGVEPETLVAAAGLYAAECERKGNTGTSYVAQASTWLNQQRWTEYAPEPAPKVNGHVDRRILTPLSSEDAVRLQYHGVAEFNSKSGHLEWTEKGLSAGRKMNWPPAPAGYQPPVTI